MRFVCLDTETTGFSRKGDVSVDHRIIEIGCVEIDDGVVTGSVFRSYINPLRSIDPKASRVHGITDKDVEDAPVFSDVVSKFLDFIGDSIVIIHNAPFDIAFLDKEFLLLPPAVRPKCVFYYIDTLAWARSMFPNQDNRLDALALRYQIDLGRDKHGALIDAMMLARVFLCMEIHRRSP